MIIFQKVFCDYVIYSTLDNTCIKLNYENDVKSEKDFRECWVNFAPMVVYILGFKVNVMDRAATLSFKPCTTGEILFINKTKSGLWRRKWGSNDI